MTPARQISDISGATHNPLFADHEPGVMIGAVR